MTSSRFKRRYLQVLNQTLNRATRAAARSGRGPFALVRHQGRKSGRTYETPVILARTADGFVAELTYGSDVDWYQNIVAAGHGVIVYRGIEHLIDRIEPCSAERGLRAFGYPRALVLRLLRRREFRLLHEAETSTQQG